MRGPEDGEYRSKIRMVTHLAKAGPIRGARFGKRLFGAAPGAPVPVLIVLRPCRNSGSLGCTLEVPMDDFIDYYELMQISIKAELPTIQRVYRMQAARYHPDNPETGDTDKFILLQKAYQVLSDPAAREAYDAALSQQTTQPLPVFEMKEFVVGVDAEMNRRLGLLCLLYNRRRANADHPSLSVFDLETKMSIPREHLEFTIWYLKEKNLVRRDEDNGEILISSEGVDYVENNSPANRIVYKLLKSGESETAHRPSDFNPEPAASS
jgi:DnaJ domain